MTEPAQQTSLRVTRLAVEIERTILAEIDRGTAETYEEILAALSRVTRSFTATLLKQRTPVLKANSSPGQQVPAD